MIVVCDTSPLNYLVLIGQADLLPVLFNSVLAPPAVMTELNHPSSPEQVRNWASAPPAWLEIVAPSRIDSALNLGLGEGEAICLALELDAAVLLVDERKATSVARRLGLATVGTIGVLAVAAEKRLLDLDSSIAALRQTSFREPKELVDEQLKSQRRRFSGP
jgi:predicted nucleic acid-binding protein